MLAASFSSWGCIDIFATLLVAIGVIGELWAFLLKVPFNPTNFPTLESKKKTIEKWSLIILCVGVFVEVLALPNNLSEIAGLQKQTASLVASNIVNEATIEKLRQKNDAFENRLPRAEKFNVETFDICLKGFMGKTKPKVEVLYSADDDADSIELVQGIGVGLGNAGWQVDLPRLMKEEDIPTEYASQTNHDIPLDERMSGGIPADVVIIGNPNVIGVQPGQMDTYRPTSSTNKLGEEIWFVMKTDNVGLSLSSSLADSGAGSVISAFDTRLPNDLIKIVVEKHRYFWEQPPWAKP